MPFLSVIIITYNSQHVILNCLASVILQKKDSLEVIVVDNGSCDNTIQIIKNKFPQVRLICNRANLGFSAAANQGIAYSRGEYVLLLNSDAVLAKDFMAKIESALGRLPDKNIGMVSPKILRPDGRIDSAGLSFNFLRKLYDRGTRRRNINSFNRSKYIFGPCGACAIYKRKMLEDIKINNEYFDEDFFLIAEDFDLAWRANLLGWRGWFMPELICYHQGGISRKRTKISQYYAFRNRCLLLIKNERGAGLLRLILFFWVYDLPRLFYLLFTNCRYTIRALCEIKHLLPSMLQKRNLLKAKIKSSKRK